MRGRGAWGAVTCWAGEGVASTAVVGPCCLQSIVLATALSSQVGQMQTLTG